MRITVLAGGGRLNSTYRAFRPTEALSARGHRIRLDTSGEDKVRPEMARTLAGFDLLYIHRYHAVQTRRLVERAREMGIAVVWDNDDDLVAWDLQRTKREVRSLRASRAHFRDIERMVQLVDVVTTPSPALEEIYLAAGAREVHRIENHLPADYGRVLARPHERVVVGWVAGSEHTIDVRELELRSTLRQLIDRHPQVEVHSIGVDLELDRGRYDHTRIVQFHDLAQATVGFDIGIAPLADVPFNRARSNCKLKEYAGVGVPWLASPIGPYVGMGEKQGGRLVPDDGWYEALEEMVINGRLRKKLAKRARKWAEGETIHKNAHLWEAAMEAAVARGRQRTGRTAVSA